MTDKYKSLEKRLKELGSVLVAYSGGVDSTFLLKAAVDALGPQNVLAVIATGPTLPRSRLTGAIEVAKDMGAEVQTLETDEMADENFTANKADRCLHCKNHLFARLTELAAQRGFDHVVFGCNTDDLSDFRPGHRAAEQFDVKAPLADAGLSKQDIRDLSRQLGLATADMPASPCLASRISYGLEVTAARLNQVEKAEEFLRLLGLSEFRVRHHDAVARIEVHPEDFDKIVKEPFRGQIAGKLKALGFKYVTVDLQGFRSGSLNEQLREDEKRPNRRGIINHQ